jgi:hypothetical protein
MTDVAGPGTSKLPTEWVLQEELTSAWYVSGGLDTGGERFFLAGWEVMDNWRVNDAHRHWNRPSIDFLFVDSTGQLVAGELKRVIAAPRECWSALCQVTHRAHLLASSFTLEGLESVYARCRSGEHGRGKQATPTRVAEAWSRYFGQDALNIRLGVGPVRRVVLAFEFGPNWADILEQFNVQDLRVTVAQLRKAYRLEAKNNHEIDRFGKLVAGAGQLAVAGEVTATCVDRSGNSVGPHVRGPD